jgi:hypothetical protein
MSYEQIPNWSYSGKPVYTQTIVGGSLGERSMPELELPVDPILIPLPIGNNSPDESNPRYTLIKSLFDDEGDITDRGRKYTFYNSDRTRIDFNGKIQSAPLIDEDGNIYYMFRASNRNDTDEMFYSVDQGTQRGGIKRRKKTQRSKGKGKRKNRRSKRR